MPAIQKIVIKDIKTTGVVLFSTGIIAIAGIWYFYYNDRNSSISDNRGPTDDNEPNDKKKNINGSNVTLNSVNQHIQNNITQNNLYLNLETLERLFSDIQTLEEKVKGLEKQNDRLKPLLRHLLVLISDTKYNETNLSATFLKIKNPHRKDIEKIKKNLDRQNLEQTLEALKESEDWVDDKTLDHIINNYDFDPQEIRQNPELTGAVASESD